MFYFDGVSFYWSMQPSLAKSLLRFSLRANSKSDSCERLNFMALENARFSFQKLAMSAGVISFNRERDRIID